MPSREALVACWDSDGFRKARFLGFYFGSKPEVLHGFRICRAFGLLSPFSDKHPVALRLRVEKNGQKNGGLGHRGKRCG